MKKIFYFLAVLSIGFTACTKSDFADSYADPSKISTTTAEKQFAGFLTTNREYVIPSYWNYFVVLRTSINHYTQSVGWENSPSQYIPGAAGITDRWNNFYNFTSQFREFQKVFGGMSADDQTDRRIYMIAATIFFYDHSEKVVDLHGDIPWSDAGKLSANGGDYANSLPKYDEASAIYTKMLDDLKAFAEELNAIVVKPGIVTGFKNQDIINNGDMTMWKRYCNSLRLRMLTRVSDVGTFQARANTEIGQILSTPATYPVVTSNAENIQIKIFDQNTPINSQGFQTGLEDWNGNIAGKLMIDHMKANGDPRLRAVFEPGTASGGVYNGLDPLLASSAQNALINGGTLAIYNRSTISRNDFFPGVLINAAEVSLIAAEYYLKNANDGVAKTAYENAIRQSVQFYYSLRTISNDNTSGPLAPATDAEVNAYIASGGANWTGTTANKLQLIGMQKWLHFNVIQPLDNWAEVRRLNSPVLTFQTDNSNTQAQPPTRWIYPGSELTYNSVNYEAVMANDKLTTRIFWDTN